MLRVGGKIFACFSTDNVKILPAKGFEVITAKVNIINDAAGVFHIFERIFKQAVIDTQHYITVHLNEPAEGIPGKTLIS